MREAHSYSASRAMVERWTPPKNIIRNVGKFINHWSPGIVTVNQNWLRSGDRVEAVMGILATANKVQTMLSVKKLFISVHEKWYRTT